MAIANLKLSTEGAVGLRLKDGTELFLEHDEKQGHLYVYTSILLLPTAHDVRLRLFAHMLELNFLGSGLAHGTLSIQRDMAMCHVSVAIANLQVDTLDQLLHYLLDSRANLIAKVEACIKTETSDSLRARRSTASLLAVLR
ncbi:type III secretion system chaperone [Noviherbaspirillum sp. Root189]|uniref:type III secretion system chaperone n=1 Tax=Noviherbaspirillum sp. Root189 TaxID=1736487 RepID=UPI00138F4AD0|nr:type III secretion system chaperone [Noviherbaspirillum sp. Root189]